MKAKTFIYIACLLVVTGIGLALLPEKPLKQQLIEALQNYRKYFPQEKIYLQMDKDYYASGRTIWYKAYVTMSRQPTALSTILYVELLNKKGKVIQSNKRPIKDGGAYGNFKLDPDMTPGDYRIRAYTQWMLNFDPDYLFNKDVHIFKPLTADQKLPKSPADTTKSDFAVQFFPEGGEMIDSLKGLVAFKAIGQDGYPVKVEGVLLNKQGQPLDTIHSVHDGMGSFDLMPLPGESYQARMKIENGKQKTFQLPAAKPYGVSLHLIKINDQKVFFQVKKREQNPATDEKLKIAAHIGGHLTYFADIDFGQGYTGGLIPTKNEPAGIMQVTLFTNEGNPLAERLIFVKNKEALQPLNISMDTVSLAKRGRNVYTLNVPDTLAGNFSVSVTDADQVVQSQNQDNIVSHLLLTTDIKGFVYNPAWYFSANDSATLHGLDLVMLTNGWRRFEWQNILNKKYPTVKYAPEPNNLHFVGKIYTHKGPVKTGRITMMLRTPIDSTTYFMSGAAEPSGLFKIDHLTFLDTAFLYYKAMDTLHKRKPVEVKFVEGPETDYTLLHHRIKPPAPPLPPSLKNYLDIATERNQTDQYISNRSILLKEVEVTARRIPKEKSIEERYTSGMFKSDNGYTFDLTDKTLPYTNILQFLMGRVAGLQIGSNPSNPSVRWRGGTPGFFLDEVPADIDQIMNVPVDDIALIKVYRPPFMGGFGGANGAIAIYTRRGGDRSFSPGAGFTKKKVVGYSIVKKFYSPDYSVKKKVNELPDKRTTIYWNPVLRADSTRHHLKIAFYNTDITKRMRIIIEGITNNGKIGRIEKIVK